MGDQKRGERTSKFISETMAAAHVGPTGGIPADDADYEVWNAALDTEFREMIDRSVQRRQLEQAVVVAAMEDMRASRGYFLRPRTHTVQQCMDATTASMNVCEALEAFELEQIK